MERTLDPRVRADGEIRDRRRKVLPFLSFTIRFCCSSVRESEMGSRVARRQGMRGPGIERSRVTGGAAAAGDREKQTFLLQRHPGIIPIHGTHQVMRRGKHTSRKRTDRWIFCSVTHVCVISVVDVLVSGHQGDPGVWSAGRVSRHTDIRRRRRVQKSNFTILSHAWTL